MPPSGKTSRRTFPNRLNEMVRQLRGQIQDGRFKHGDFLPSEKELVQQFQLSNKSVRKGLELLMQDGLVVKINRVGTKVIGSAPEASVTVTFGCHSTIERDFGLSQLLDDFHSLHPAIRVTTVPLVANEYKGTAVEYLQNGIVDVLTINNMDFMFSVDYRSTHLLEPMEPAPGSYAFANEAFMNEGTLLARPVVFSPLILAYNRAHFREAGVPEPDGSWTWETALRHAAVLTKSGESTRHGLYFHLMSDNRWPAFLLQSGSRFETNGEGNQGLAGSRLLDSIRLCKRIIRDGTVFPNYMSENSDDVNELFKQGKVSMILTTYTTLNELKQAAVDYDISPLPFLDEPRSLVNVIGVAINGAAKGKEAAKQLVDYLTSTRAQQLIRRHTLSLAASKKVAEAPFAEDGDPMNGPSRYFLFREIMASYRLHSELDIPARAFPLLRRLLKEYWSDLLTEQELREQAEQLLNSRAHASKPV